MTEIITFKCSGEEALEVGYALENRGKALKRNGYDEEGDKLFSMGRKLIEKHEPGRGQEEPDVFISQ